MPLTTHTVTLNTKLPGADLPLNGTWSLAAANNPPLFKDPANNVVFTGVQKTSTLNGTAVLEIPATGQPGFLPLDGKWRLWFKSRDNKYELGPYVFTLTADMDLADIAAVTGAPITPSLIEQAEAIKDELLGLGNPFLSVTRAPDGGVSLTEFAGTPGSPIQYDDEGQPYVTLAGDDQRLVTEATAKQTAETAYGRPLRNVASRGTLVDQRSNGTDLSQTSRTRHVIRGGAALVRLVYANWYLPSGSAEQPMGNSYDVKASIENPATSTGNASGTVTIPVFFGGKRTATIENNGAIVSDPVLINVAADWPIYVRSLATVTSGGRFPTPYATNTSNSAQADTSGVSEGFVTNTDSVDSGTISAAGGFVFGPVAIVVEALNNTHTHGVVVIGDSIARGTGIVNPVGSFLAQASINAGLPVMRLAVGGDSFTYSKSTVNVFRRAQLARFARHAVVNMGINDIRSGSDLPTLKADALAYWGMLAGQGIKVHQATILPSPGASTDGYTTASGQSIVNSGWETVRTGFNSWLRDTSSGGAVEQSAGVLTSVIDAAAVIEVNATGALTLNGGRWKVAPGGITKTGTATGVTSTTVVDAGAGRVTNADQNQVLRITGATTGAGQIARITSNTSTTWSLNPAFTTTPTGTVTYQIAPAYCWDHLHPTEGAHILIANALNLTYLKAV